MKTKSNNPLLLSHAGLIYAMTGDKAKAKTFLENVVRSKANIPEPLRTEIMVAFQKH